MRVIAGTYGGRTLKAPPGDSTRPTSDRVREALFSILGARLPDARVLDLFAGSGALGLEALSRGAQSVTFVDDAAARDQGDQGQLAGALRGGPGPQAGRPAVPRPRITERAPNTILSSSIPRTGRRSVSRGPLSEALPAVLAPGAVAVAESDRRAPLALDLPLHDERRYGDTLIRIYGP